MPKLIAVGYWNSKFFQEDRFIYPHEIVSESKLPDMLKLADYVAKGNSAIAWKGYSACRICDKILGTRCLTDGAYIWPEKLEHYIVEHDIFLPQEFIDHAKNNKWQVKKPIIMVLIMGKLIVHFGLIGAKNTEISRCNPILLTSNILYQRKLERAN